MIKKRIKRIIFSVLGVILLLVLFFAQSPVCTVWTYQVNDNSKFLRDCVTQNENLKDKPITEISILGSHDALSNDISYASKQNSSEDNVMVNNPFIRILAKGAVVRLAKAQQHNIYDQLKAGVRYIDARITYVDGVYYTSHGLISNTLEYNMNLILKFLAENPGEYVLFNINNYYPSTSNFSNLMDYISSIKYEGKNLFDYVNYSSEFTHFYEVTYNNATNNGTEAGVICFSDQDNLIYPFNQFSTSEIRDVWHEEGNFKTINEKIKKEAEYCKTLDNTYLKINQTQMTPNFSQPLSIFLDYSLLHAAKYHNADLINLKEIDEIVDAMPIFMADFVTSNYKDFNKTIVSKLYSRNIKL